MGGGREEEEKSTEGYHGGCGEVVLELGGVHAGFVIVGRVLVEVGEEDGLVGGVCCALGAGGGVIEVA